MSSPQHLPGGTGWSPRPGYQRPGAYGVGPAGQLAGTAGTTGPTGMVGQPASLPEWARPAALQRHRRGDVAKYVIGVLGGLGLLALLVIITRTAGGGTHVLIPFALALIPLVVVLATVFWIDRWEPEPLGTLVAAFLWGAGVATLISMVVNTTTAVIIASSTGDPTSAEMFSAVISAPIIEEGTKGLGVLVIFLIWRRSFNGAVDGIVYAAVVAAGFAFAENIMYFVQYSDVLMQTFLMRAVFSPFAHVTFTACTGLAIGLSARMRSRAAWVWTTPLGLACAMLLHAFWNGAVSSMPSLYLMVEVPFFLICAGIVIWLRSSERATMRKRLADYGRAGWFAPEEITMLTTGSGRATAQRWAKGRGPASAQAMKEFQRATAALAQLRQQALDGHAEADYQSTEDQLLRTVAASRTAFLGQR